jgi:hypothetical protein
MADFIPQFRLYASDGITLEYTFEYITDMNWPQEGEAKFIEHKNLRSNGSIIVPCGISSWDLVLTGCLLSTDYASLITKKTGMQTDIALQTRYILQIDKSAEQYDELKVMRVSEIKWDKTNHRTFQFYTITFKVGCWA